jgi:hypothetical protein
LNGIGREAALRGEIIEEEVQVLEETVVRSDFMGGIAVRIAPPVGAYAGREFSSAVCHARKWERLISLRAEPELTDFSFGFRLLAASFCTGLFIIFPAFELFFHAVQLKFFLQQADGMLYISSYLYFDHGKLPQS